MASEDRSPTSCLVAVEQLASAPYEFDFFQALRWIDAANRNRPSIGRARRFGDEIIQLVQDPALRFAPASLTSYTSGSDGAPPRLGVSFFGLLGPNGPLPIHLSEHARDRLRNHHDATFVRFLDIFHHRFLTLFYRAWAVAQPAVSFDRPASDRFSDYVGATSGLGSPALFDRDAVPDLAKRYYAGFLAGQTRHAHGLKSILEGFFNVPIRIDEFVGHWLPLPAEGLTQLGADNGADQLGVSTILGSRVWDRQNKFRVVLGPLAFAAFRGLLPGTPGLKRLRDWLRNYVGDVLDWEINLVLKRQEVPCTRLGEQGELGWTTWLGSSAGQVVQQSHDGTVSMLMTHDPADLMLSKQTVMGS